MSKHELIGYWVEKRQEANALAGQKRAELAVLRSRFFDFLEVLQVGVNARIEAWLGANTLPSQEEFMAIFASLREAEKKASEANEQLRNLGV